MSIPHMLARAAAAAMIILVAACTDSPDSGAPTGGGALAPARGGRTGAPEQAELARSIRGFGGVFVDRDGVPTVYLTDPSQRGVAQAGLMGYLRSHGLDPASLRVRQADFELAQLDRWFVTASPEVLALPGTVYVDLNEATNRLTIGVLDAGGTSAARAVTARLGIPDAAVETVETEPIHFVATLRDQIRPVLGGLQIHFSQYLCSIGFNAVDGTQSSFITASHCTKRQGGVESTLYYQPLSSAQNSFVGTEVEDPTYFRGGFCPRGYKCRWSDAARVAYAAGVSHTLGGIAKTSGANNGSLVVTGSFNVTSETTNPVLGQIVNKVGRTTGWTSGRVTSTCVDTGVSGSNIALLCQSFVRNDAGSVVVGAGDSGSNVFRITGGGTDASVNGVLWGGSSDNKLFVFSPMSGVEKELGQLTTQ